MNVGHTHPEVVEAIKNQCDRFLHYSNTDFYYKEAINLAENLQTIAPGNLEKKVYFGNSGTEAVEAAIKLARWHTRKQSIHRVHRRFSRTHNGFVSFYRQQTKRREAFFCLLCPAYLMFLTPIVTVAHSS